MTFIVRTAAERFGLPIPFGWFAIARSAELGSAEVKPLSWCGEDFVLWRGEDGQARVLDAYCPHLGSHMGFGGTVVGNDLRCPFHHWQFRGDGSVARIPYSRTVPPLLKRPCDRAWPVFEDMGLIFAWWHPQRAAPLWQLEPVEEIAHDGWIVADYREWTFDVHIQEINENAADVAHFPALHGLSAPPAPELRVDGYMRYSSMSSRLPTSRGEVEGKITVRAPGPGLSFTRFWGITDMLLLQTQTPLDGGRTVMRHTYFHPVDLDERRVNVTRKLIANTQLQLEQDATVWPHKKHLEKPILVQGDGPILQYRKFFERFYAQ